VVTGDERTGCNHKRARMTADVYSKPKLGETDEPPAPRPPLLTASALDVNLADPWIKSRLSWGPF